MPASLLLWLWLAQATAHPSHTSFAELGWSAGGDVLEVALRVIPEDLEAVLSTSAGRRTALRDTPAVRALLGDWLGRSFIVRDSAGRPGRIDLLGMELDYDAAWLYFTIRSAGPGPLTLENTVLQDLAIKRGVLQFNSVQRLWLGPEDRLLFTAEQPVQRIN